jgi:hypothetical protein
VPGGGVALLWAAKSLKAKGDKGHQGGRMSGAVVCILSHCPVFRCNLYLAKAPV